MTQQKSSPSSDSVGREIPAGFVPISAGGPFLETNGPLYLCKESGRVRIGMRIEQRHINPLGQLHGGMMATFCDMVLPLGVHFIEQRLASHFLLTVSLQVDFLAPAPLGSWLEGSAELLRATGSLVFVRGLVTADGEPCARSSGVFKIGPQIPPDFHALR